MNKDLYKKAGSTYILNQLFVYSLLFPAKYLTL
jgi:hypothetical protein